MTTDTITVTMTREQADAIASHLRAATEYWRFHYKPLGGGDWMEYRTARAAQARELSKQFGKGADRRRNSFTIE